MPWINPKTWIAGEVVSAADLNAHIRDNEIHLFNQRGKAGTLRDNNANYTSTSTTFVDVDATNLSRTVTIRSGFALVGFTCVIDPNNGSAALDLAIDGTRFAAGSLDGIAMCYSNTIGRQTVSFVVLVQGLSDGVHTFKVQWKSNGSTVSMFAGAGSASLDSFPHFWVLEVG